MKGISIKGLTRLASIFRKESREAFDTNLIADKGKYIRYYTPDGDSVEGIIEGVEYPEEISENAPYIEHTATPELPELQLRTGILDVRGIPLYGLSNYEVIDPPAWATRLFPQPT
jgi:hypothetical protein